MDYSALYRAKKDLLRETSIYTSREMIRNLHESHSLSRVHKRFVKVVACEPDEQVCRDNYCDSSRPFCFFYGTVFIKLYLHLPLTIFEKEILTELNFCPTQLHLNSWAFIRAFVILCSHFEISPTLNIFFYFFEFTFSKLTFGLERLLDVPQGLLPLKKLLPWE